MRFALLINGVLLMPSVKITGATPFNDYSFTVKGRNPMGTGFPETTGPHQFNFNKATGGGGGVTCKHEWTIWRSWEVCDLCGEVK